MMNLVTCYTLTVFNRTTAGQHFLWTEWRPHPPPSLFHTSVKHALAIWLKTQKDSKVYGFKQELSCHSDSASQWGVCWVHTFGGKHWTGMSGGSRPEARVKRGMFAFICAIQVRIVLSDRLILKLADSAKEYFCCGCPLATFLKCWAQTKTTSLSVLTHLMSPLLIFALFGASREFASCTFGVPSCVNTCVRNSSRRRGNALSVFLRFSLKRKRQLSQRLGSMVKKSSSESALNNVVTAVSAFGH